MQIGLCLRAFPSNYFGEDFVASAGLQGGALASQVLSRPPCCPPGCAEHPAKSPASCAPPHASPAWGWETWLEGPPLPSPAALGVHGYATALLPSPQLLKGLFQTSPHFLFFCF